jgi:flagellar FliL protein
MAAKEEKKSEEKPDDKAKGKEPAKAEPPKDPNEKMSKKNKIIIIAAIGGILILLFAVGGFIFYKTMKAKQQAELEIAQDAAPTEVGTEDKAAEKKDDHGDKKDEKKDDHGDKKDEKKDDSGAKKDEKKDDSGAKKDEKKGTSNFGDTYIIPKMELNLGNPIENRFLRLAVAIEYRGGEEQQAELKKREIQIKDIIITSVTSKTRVQLLSENGKELLRREILNKINEVADKPTQNIFFTEFLVE